MSYDDTNIFARLLRGEIPSHRVYEDDAVIAFMDVMPQGKGHTLVVPRAPSRNLLDADPATLVPLFAVTQKMAQAVKKAFAADGVTIMQFNEAASGQTVYHCTCTSSHASKACHSSGTVARWRSPRCLLRMPKRSRRLWPVDRPGAQKSR